MHGGLIRLSVDVDARALDDFLNGWVDEASAGVVATIADLQYLVAKIWLSWKGWKVK